MSLSHCKLGTDSGNIGMFSSDVPLPLQIGTESRNIGIFNSDVPLPLQIGDREREYLDI